MQKIFHNEFTVHTYAHYELIMFLAHLVHDVNTV